MDMTYISGRSFLSDTQGTKDENTGNWTVRVVITETLSYPNGTNRSESVEGVHTDKDFHEAHKYAMRDALQLVQDLVYTRGFDSLIEAVDYDRSLEENDATAKADEAPASE